MSAVEAEHTPIGAVVREIEKKLWNVGAFKELAATDPETLAQIDLIYSEYDTLFQSRSDYLLWRAFVKPHFSHRRPWTHDIQGAQAMISGKSLKSIVFGGVEDGDPIQVWSIAALMPSIFASLRSQEDIVSKSELSQIANRLLGRIKYEIFPIVNSEASCGATLAALLINMAGYDRASVGRITTSGLFAFCEDIERALHLIDPLWTPGERLNLFNLGRQQNGPNRLSPGNNAHQYTELVQSLINFRKIVERNVNEISPATDQILKKAFGFSKSAWIMARARRLSEIENQEKLLRRGKLRRHRAAKARRRLYNLELSALLEASGAARDAGEYLESSKLAYLLLRTVPEEYAGAEWMKKVLSKYSGLFRYIGEAGLVKDARFSTDHREEEFLAVNRLRWEQRKNEWERRRSAALASVEIITPLAEEDARPFMRRVANDQKANPDWRCLFEEIDASNQSPFGYLLTIEKCLGDAGFDASSQALRSAFRVRIHNQ